MDEILRARKMGSASARRKRIQERREEQERALQQYEEHRMGGVSDDATMEDNDYGSEYSDTDIVMEDSHRESESSVETPSEYSVITPDDSPPIDKSFDKEPFEHPNITTSTIHLVETVCPVDVDRITTAAPPSPMPQLQASLVALSDFRYDRYSMLVVAPPVIPPPAPELEFDEAESPLETARPISFRLPKSRPSVISITSTSKRARPRTASIQSRTSETDGPIAPPPRSLKRLSQVSTRSGFPAAEATLFQVPDLPPNATAIIANASKDKIPAVSHAPITRGVSKKSSVPLLSAALKTSHARMNSIKSFIKPAHMNTPSLSFSRPASRHSRPPTSTGDHVPDFSAFETVPTSINDPPAAYRPRTGNRPPIRESSLNPVAWTGVTALPAVPAPAGNDAILEAAPISRKKSFSKIRKRSESIGQAIKAAAIKNKQPSLPTSPTPPPMHVDSPEPAQVPAKPTGPLPVSVLAHPALIVSDPEPSLDLGTFPTPPLPSLKSRKSLGGFSPFPPSPRLGAPMGLGLKV